jgi:hypothetical protein
MEALFVIMQLAEERLECFSLFGEII